ncbi:hypothetical protein BDF14DRAFT_1784612 [Spinellus fusiger]|nr:hypothetical protein BDF14DRAFT_1784612 [Spinellus fusiger]
MDSFRMEESATVFNINNNGHCKIKEFLECCKLPQYLLAFISEGFESLPSLYEITEDDMIFMEVKRGHRRVIQREIAYAQGIPRHQPLEINVFRQKPSIFMRSVLSPISNNNNNMLLHHQRVNNQRDIITEHHGNTSGSGCENSVSGNSSSSSGYGSMSSSKLSENMSGAENPLPPAPAPPPSQQSSPAVMRNSNSSSNDEDSGDVRSSNLPKRKYRRHPKVDVHAPIKPPSAYIMFSNNTRAQLKDQSMSFADIAKLVGDQWKNLSHEDKQAYERTAMRAKDEYVSALEIYQQTSDHKKYQNYLKDFMVKQGTVNRLLGRTGKRPKRVFNRSDSMSGSSSNSGGNGTSNGSSGDNESSKIGSSSTSSPEGPYTTQLRSVHNSNRTNTRSKASFESGNNNSSPQSAKYHTNPPVSVKGNQSKRSRARSCYNSIKGNSTSYPQQSTRRVSPRQAKQASPVKPFYNTRRRNMRWNSEDSSLSPEARSPSAPVNGMSPNDLTGNMPMKWTPS